MPEDRISTSVRNLDEKMGGGILAGQVVLLCGRAGTMKSSLAFSILHNAAKREGRRGVYLTLEQSREGLVDPPSTALHNAAKRGGRRGVSLTREQPRESLVAHPARLGMDPRLSRDCSSV